MMEKAFDDIIKHAVDVIFDEGMTRQAARDFLPEHLAEKLRPLGEYWGRKVENSLRCWLLGVD